MLSARLARVPQEHIDSAIGEALAAIAAATDVDSCQLFEFTESGALARSHVSAGDVTACGQLPQTPTPASWLVHRLAHGTLVTVSGPEDVPREAKEARLQAGRTGIGSILGVPTSIDGRVVSAVVLDSVRSRRLWPPPLVERMQILSAILGAALQCADREKALRANVAVVEGVNARLEADNQYLKEEINSHHDFDDIVGESASLTSALKRVAQVAPTNSSVLLLGQTGTGKELFARALHERSRRHTRPLVRVNCAALPPTLIESELFGHEKGAYTGAVDLRQGRFELADGGTIFLDEIGDLALDIQVKFLRVLQEGEFERVGSSRTRRVDVRVIAATHHDLETAVATGRFRADLYYRLSVYPIHLPSLRERPEDIPRLTWCFIHRIQRGLGRHITKVPPSVMDALQQYAWPGNVRELENVIERALIASSGDTLQLDAPLALSTASTICRPMAEDALEDVDTENLDAVQRAHIEAVLERCGWRINGKGNAAERLGLHPNTLRFRMRSLGIVRSPNHRRQHRHPLVPF